MTRATSKAAARRRRKRKISLAGGQFTQPPTQGRRNDLPAGPPPILAARAARCNIEPASTLHADDMGRCILALTQGDERAALQNTWAALSAAHRNYRLRYVGQTGDPKIAATPMLSESMETDPSLRVDLRTPDERDEAAKRVWADWQARIKALPVQPLAWIIRGALDGFMGECKLWEPGRETVAAVSMEDGDGRSYVSTLHPGRPTKSGVSAVHALKLLTDGLR